MNSFEEKKPKFDFSAQSDEAIPSGSAYEEGQKWL